MRTFILFLILCCLNSIDTSLERIADKYSPVKIDTFKILLPSDSTIHRFSKRLGGP